MDASLARELTLRWVAGDPLSPAEERGLLQWLDSHPEDRDDLLRDETLDSLLRCMNRLDATGEEFLQESLRRAATWQPSAPPANIPIPPSITGPPKADSPVAIKRSNAVWDRARTVVGDHRWVTAIACSIAILAAGAVGVWMFARGPRSVDGNGPSFVVHAAPRPVETESKQPEPQRNQSFARLARCTQALWDSPRAEGDRLSTGILKLVQGDAELKFDSGTVVSLTGPSLVELCSADTVLLQRGSLTAHVPRPAIGFTVVTPLSRVVDLGTEFDVAVDESGYTETTVRQGSVSLRPQQVGQQPGESVRLTAAGLNYATISASEVKGQALPLVTVVGGDEGRFLGQLSLGGKSAVFHSPKAFEEFHDLALRRLEKAPGPLGQEWSNLVAAVAAAREPSANHVDTRQEASGVRKPDSLAGAETPSRKDGGSIVHAAPPLRAAAVVENGKEGGQELSKTVSITHGKDSGITVTFTEIVNGNKRTTQVHAASAAELARKYPYVHHLYRQFLRSRAALKAGKGK